MRWRATETGFLFEGLPGSGLPSAWLSNDVRAQRQADVVLGPEPIIGPQQIALVSVSDPSRTLVLATDGVHPFKVRADANSAQGAP